MLSEKSLKPELNNRIEFSSSIKALRKKSGLSLKAASQRIDVSISYISRLESGERKPSRDVVLSMADTYCPNDKQQEDRLLLSAGFSPNHLVINPESNDIISLHAKSLEKNPNDLNLFVSLVFSMIKSGNYEKAKDKIQEGFQRFNDGTELKCLLASLSMLEGKYKEAIQLQSSALNHFRTLPNKNINIKETGLLLNLGVIYFMEGYVFIDRYIEARQTEAKDLEIELKGQAQQSLLKAKEILQEALVLDSGNIFVKDEIARVNFNLAYLSEGEEASGLWKETIDSFQQVISSDDKFKLGEEELLEGCAFLGHAYTKDNQFELAQTILNLVEVSNREYWLVHYVKACYYSRKYSFEGTEGLLDKSLVCLEGLIRLLGVDDPSVQEARFDPDLKVLRANRPDAFDKLFNGGKVK